MKLFGCFLLWMIVFSDLTAQPIYDPRLGEAFPDFTFSNVQNFPRKQVGLVDFKGKWLIMDFWSVGCTACFSTFKVIKQIQSTHGDHVKFLLVGSKDTGYNVNIETVYDRISSNLKLKAPIVFDTAKRETWGINAYPYMFIISPEGILHAITDGRDLTVEKIGALIAGQPVKFYPVGLNTIADKDHIVIDDQVSTLSMIRKSDGKFQDTDIDPLDIPSEQNPSRWSIFNVPLYGLYNYAYFGRWLWTMHDSAFYGKINAYPVLEMSDSSAFAFDFKTFPSAGTYDCVIKLTGGKLTTVVLMAEIQQALTKSFGYTVTIQTREIPVWKLTAKPWSAKRMQSSGGKAYQNPGSAAGGFVLKNQPMHRLMVLLSLNLPDNDKTPYLDFTGIKGKVDFSIEADMTDLKDIQHGLDPYGLSFVKSTTPMKVLVLSTPPAVQSN